MKWYIKGTVLALKAYIGNKKDWKLISKKALDSRKLELKQSKSKESRKEEKNTTSR